MLAASGPGQFDASRPVTRGVPLHTAVAMVELGYEVAECNLLRTDLYLAEEAFLTGTAAEVVPIRSVDDRVIGEPGPMTKAIQETYFATVRGEVDQYKDWLDHVSS